jgi:hypothetical protein
MENSGALAGPVAVAALLAAGPTWLASGTGRAGGRLSVLCPKGVPVPALPWMKWSDVGPLLVWGGGHHTGVADRHDCNCDKLRLTARRRGRPRPGEGRHRHLKCRC